MELVIDANVSNEHFHLYQSKHEILHHFIILLELFTFLLILDVKAYVDQMKSKVRHDINGTPVLRLLTNLIIYLHTN